MAIDSTASGTSPGASTETEKTLGQLGITLLRDRLPKLVGNIQGFQLMESDESGQSAFGVFALSIGGAIAYIPTFFRAGKIYGQELVFLRDKQLMLPTTEGWFEYIQEVKGGVDIGKPASQSEVNAPVQHGGELDQFNRGPQGFKLASADSLIKIATDTGALRSIGAWGPSNIQPWAKEASALMSDARSEFRTKLASFDLLETLPKFKLDPAQAVKAAGARMFDFYDANEVYTKLSSDRSVRDAKPLSLLDRTHLNDVNVIRLTDLKNDIQGITDTERAMLLGRGYLVKDTRNRFSRVLPTTGQVSMSIQMRGIAKKSFGVIGGIMGRPASNIGEDAPQSSVSRGYAVMQNGKSKDVLICRHDDRVTIVSEDGKAYARLTDKDTAGLGVIEAPSEKELTGLPAITELGQLDRGNYFVFVSKAGALVPAVFCVKATSPEGMVLKRDASLNWYNGPVNSVHRDDASPSAVITLSGKTGSATAKDLDGCNDCDAPRHLDVDDTTWYALRLPDAKPSMSFLAEVARMNKTLSAYASGMPGLRVRPSSNSYSVEMADGTKDDRHLTKIAHCATISDVIEVLARNFGLDEESATKVANDRTGETYPYQPAAGYPVIEQFGPTSQMFTKQAYAMDLSLDPNTGSEPFSGARSTTNVSKDEIVGGVQNQSAHEQYMLKPEDHAHVSGMAETGANTGQKELYDLSVFSGLLKTTRIKEMVDGFLPTMLLAVDHVGRTLFLVYAHYDKFSERYGANDLPKLISALQDNHQQSGETVLFLHKENLGTEQGTGDDLNA